MPMSKLCLLNIAHLYVRRAGNTGGVGLEVIDELQPGRGVRES